MLSYFEKMDKINTELSNKFWFLKSTGKYSTQYLYNILEYLLRKDNVL